MGPLQMLQLMQKYGGLKTADLTADAIKDITVSLGFNVDITPILTTQVMSLLQANDINALADLASHPAVLQKLGQLFATPAPTSRSIVRECNHCHRYNFYEVEI